jgi:hypothetical protein
LWMSPGDVMRHGLVATGHAAAANWESPVRWRAGALAGGSGAPETMTELDGGVEIDLVHRVMGVWAPM